MPATKKERAVIKAAIAVYKKGVSNTCCVPYKLARAVEELGRWK